MSTILGRPKKSKNNRIVTTIIESQDIDAVDELADELSLSRSALIREFIRVGLQIWGSGKPKSLIILKEHKGSRWYSFDPDIGVGHLKGFGDNAEEALDSFLTEEELSLDLTGKEDSDHEPV